MHFQLQPQTAALKLRVNTVLGLEDAVILQRVSMMKL
jgi:hypothetical protein